MAHKDKSGAGVAGHYAQDPAVPHSRGSECSGAKRILRENTLRMAISLMREREGREGARTDRWRTLAEVYTRAMVEGKPLSVKLPAEVHEWAQTALTQACELTGYTIPSRPQSPRKKR